MNRILLDKIRLDLGFEEGLFDSRLPAGFEGLQNPGHVEPQSPHGLGALQIAKHFFGLVAVHHVPVRLGLHSMENFLCS